MSPQHWGDFQHKGTKSVGIPLEKTSVTHYNPLFWELQMMIFKE